MPGCSQQRLLSELATKPQPFFMVEIQSFQKAIYVISVPDPSGKQTTAKCHEDILVKYVSNLFTT